MVFGQLLAEFKNTQVPEINLNKLTQLLTVVLRKSEGTPIARYEKYDYKVCLRRRKGCSVSSIVLDAVSDQDRLCFKTKDNESIYNGKVVLRGVAISTSCTQDWPTKTDDLANVSLAISKCAGHLIDYLVRAVALILQVIDITYIWIACRSAHY